MKKVLITGGTGVVGSTLAPFFLNEPDCEVHLLIRARDAAHLAERRDALVRFWGADVVARDAGERLFVHRGDASLLGLALSERAVEELARGLTHIVHAAASVRMDMSREQALASCIAPVREVLSLFDRACSLGAVPKLDCVSTLGVAGRLNGLVPELAELPSRDFHNSYEWAKAEAETLLLARMAEGAPITLHRPSMVVGHSESGKVIHRQIFYHLCRFLSGSATFGVLPDLEGVTLDLVPCDYLAKAIHWSSGNEASRGRVLHLCAGPEGAVPIMTLAEAVRDAYARHGRSVPRPRTLPLPVVEAAVGLASRLPGRTGRRFGALRRFLDYAHAAQSFACDNSQGLLAPAIGPAPGYRQFFAAQLDAGFLDDAGQGSPTRRMQPSEAPVAGSREVLS